MKYRIRLQATAAFLILTVIATACGAPAVPTATPVAAAPTAVPVAPVEVAPTAAPAAPTAAPATAAPTAPTAVPAAPAAATEKQIVVGFAQNIRSLDPATSVSAEEGSLVWVMYDYLVTYDRQDFSKIAPDLAVSWDLSPDGTVYTFQLRKGVKFTTGNDFTADDVVYSFRRGLQINHPSYPTTLLNLVDDPNEAVKKIDDYTVAMHLKAPFAAFLTLLCKQTLGIVDSKALEENKSADDPDGTAYLNEHSLGTGPFMLDQWKRNEYVRLVKNPTYWGIAANYFRVPKYDVLIDQNVPESSVQKFMLDNGDIQMAFNLTSDDVVAYEKNPNFYVVKIPTWTSTSILMNPITGTLLADTNVRNAIRWAIDYDSIITDILQGYVIRLDRPIYQPNIGSRKDGEQPLYWYDLDKAKEYMAKSEFPNGGTFTLEIGTGGGLGAPWELIAQKEAADLAKIGITMKISQQDWSVMDEKAASGKYEAEQLWAGSGMAETAGQIQVMVYPSKGFFIKPTAYRNARLDELSEIVLTESDPVKRLAAINEINQLEATDGPFAFIAQRFAPFVFPNNIAGFDKYPAPAQFDYAVLFYQ